MRDDVFAPTPSPLSVRGLLLYAAWFNLRVETGVLSRKQTHPVKCSLDLRKDKKRDGWIWRLHGATNVRTASRDFTEFLAGVLTEHMGFKRGKLERCLFAHGSNGTRVVSHVDDPLICAKLATLEKFWTQITKLVVIKRGEALNTRTCNLPGIRVRKCTRWRSQRIHSETYCQVRGRMLGHCSTAECRGSDDAFDGRDELESARRDDSV